MAIQQCEFGHFYDNERMNECPMCKKLAGSAATGFDMQSQVTVSGYKLGNASGGMTELLSGDDFNGEQFDFIDSAYDAMADENSTIGYFAMNGMGNYTTGWLVEVNGIHKGQAYNLFIGRNRCGRDADNDICIQDPAVIAQRHCSVVYENNQNAFFLSPESGAVFFNDEYLDHPVELKSGDKIHIGETDLIFIPFCTDDRRW